MRGCWNRQRGFSILVGFGEGGEKDVGCVMLMKIPFEHVLGCLFCWVIWDAFVLMMGGHLWLYG